jgi:Ca2+-transporting ATPase
MHQRPRPATAQLLDPLSLRFIVVTGCAKAFAGLAFLVLMPYFGYALLETRTAVFLYESMAQLVFAYPSRRLTLNPRRNSFLHIAVLGGIALQGLTVLLPSLRALLGLVPVDLTIAMLIGAGVLWSWAVAEAVGWWLGAHDGTRRPSSPA